MLGGPMIKQLFIKHLDKILYLVFGALTPAVNIGVYWLCAHPLGLPVVPSTVIAWFFAVFFAYVTNRKWVFHSEASTRKEIIRESVSFFLCRLGTGVLDWVLMYLLVDCLHWPDLWVKTGVNILVILLNYVASKLLVFKQKT